MDLILKQKVIKTYLVTYVKYAVYNRRGIDGLLFEECKCRFIGALGENIGKSLMRGEMLKWDGIIEKVMTKIVRHNINMFTRFRFWLITSDHNRTQIVDVE